jgi:hypothetical protein
MADKPLRNMMAGGSLPSNPLKLLPIFADSDTYPCTSCAVSFAALTYLTAVRDDHILLVSLIL